MRIYPGFIVFLALFLCGGARPDALPPPIVPQCVGVNIHFTGAPARDLDGLESGGFGWIRMDFAWEAIEKVKGKYDFSAYDTLVAGLAARHIKPLFILDYGNALYQPDAPRSPEARAAFAKFAAAAVTHYKGKPILWEIWNEPNGGFWKPQANVAEYGRLALETARAIKQADPKATVLAPGTAGLPLDYIEGVFRTGLLRYVDAVSFHPYRGNNPETAAPEYQAVRQLIRRYAPKGKDIPLVSSEWGYSSVNVTEEQQAQYLARQWLSNLAEGIRLSIWYDWHDDGTNPTDAEHHFGTVHNDYTPKPAFVAAQALTRALGGYLFVKRLPLASDHDYLLLFLKGPQVKLAYWTTGDTHEVSLPTPGSLPLTLTGTPQYQDRGGDAALRAAASWSVTPTILSHASDEPITLALAYRNLDLQRHQARFLIQVSTLSGPKKLIAQSEGTVAPGKTWARNVSVPLPARIPVQVRVWLALEGVRQLYSQDVAVTPSDPLKLSIVPLMERSFRVQIDNPAGTPFAGRLTLSPNGLTPWVPVRLIAGQKTLEIPVPEKPTFVADCLLRDAKGNLVARLSVPTFAPYMAVLSSFHAALDGDIKVSSKVQLVSAAAPPPGGSALRLDYQFAPGWSFVRVADSNPASLPGRPLGLGMWVYGDGSGNLIRARFRDATGQTLQPGGTNINWRGWRFVSLRLVPSAGEVADIGHWGGANDGQVHFPVQIDTLLLLDSRSEAGQHSGTLWIKEPTLIYGK